MCFFIHLDYLRLAYLKKRIVDIAAPFHRGRRLLFLVFHLGAGERLGPGWFYSGNLNGLRVILPIFLQKARRLCWPQFSRIFQWKCWISHSPSINTQKDNNTNRQTSIKTENWWHLKAVDQEERGQPFFFVGHRPSRLEKEMFLLPDASGGSNSRLFVVPPLLRLLRVAALLCRQMAGSGHLFGIFAIQKSPFHKSVKRCVIYFGELYAQCRRFSGTECDIKELTSFYEENQVALTANDFNQMQMFSSQRQELPFQLQLCESANFLSSNPRQAFLCHEGTLCGSGHWWSFARKRMRRSPSSIAWLASTPSLCRLQRSKPK